MVMLLYGKKEDISDIYSHSPTTDFHATFLYNRNFSPLQKSRDEKKVAEAEQGNFYWERRLGLF